MSGSLSTQPWREGEEPPQAIADDYPGWGVACEQGRWTAWCPAARVHADSVAGLRAAIEQAIWGDVEH